MSRGPKSEKRPADVIGASCQKRLGSLYRSGCSGIAILATMTAAPITSAGRFSPRGPLGTIYPSQRGVYDPWLHYRRPKSRRALF